MKEIWKDVSGYKGIYQVSNLGRIRSLPRLIKARTQGGGWRQWEDTGRIIRQHICNSGYLTFHASWRGEKRRLMVHRLAAQAFLTSISNVEVNHLDGNRLNNCVANLEWTDRSGNNKHAYRMGLRPIGKGHHFSKLPRDNKGHCIRVQDEKADGGRVVPD